MLYVDLTDDSVMHKETYWNQVVKAHFDSQAGDEEDRWRTLREDFKMTTEEEFFEEYNGLNHHEARSLVLIVTLPMIVRTHSVAVRVMKDIISIRVPTLYKLDLGLPLDVEDS